MSIVKIYHLPHSKLFESWQNSAYVLYKIFRPILGSDGRQRYSESVFLASHGQASWIVTENYRRRGSYAAFVPFPGSPVALQGNILVFLRRYSINQPVDSDCCALCWKVSKKNWWICVGFGEICCVCFVLAALVCTMK